MLIVILFILTSGCKALSPNTIRWEFVDGFVGLIKIVETPDGSPIPKVGGEYVISVPQSGLVEVQSLDPLIDKGRINLNVPDPPGLAARRPDGAGLDFLVSPPEGVLWALVGTDDEHSFYHKNRELIESHFEAQFAERTSTER